MHDRAALVQGRLQRALDDRLRRLVHPQRVVLDVSAWDVPGEPVGLAEAMAAKYAPFALGSRWGRPWGTTWFRLTGTIPPEWDGRSIEAIIDLGFFGDGAGFQAEGLVWRDGELLQGVHPRRTCVPLDGRAGDRVELLVEAAANPWFPQFVPSAMGALDTVPERLLYRLVEADLAVLDHEVYGLVLDLEVVGGVVRGLRAGHPRRARALAAVERALDTIDRGGPVEHARHHLFDFLEQRAGAGTHTTLAVGHAHIDTAWLWPLRETKRKCERTFASAVRLMDDEPDYRFVCSQAVQYDWIRQRQPALFERIAKKVAAGQWLPVGGMWVEADMNMPSGESIVRQLVHGQRFFEEHFGVRCREVWIPDVFGYPASLPQIFAAGGCPRFVTQKLSWNKENRFPHSSFWWEGIDGSRVLTHFPPVDTYNANLVPEEQLFLEQRFQDHAWSAWSLTPYGYGNGGGGPTREMVERARRMADVDGLPRIELGTVDEFFERVEAEAAVVAAPVWRGELYLETHRGTLTSQVRTKLGNRRCERLLHEAELWWALLGWPSEVAAELGELWKAVLVLQFHDILPGSSIAWVHREAEVEHARIADRLELLIGDALARLAPAGAGVASARSRDRREVVMGEVVMGDAVPAGGGTVQPLASGGVAFVTDVPAMGVAPATVLAVDDRVEVAERSLRNGHVHVTLDDAGAVSSIVSLDQGRELLRPGRAVGLHLAPDHPVEYDAWNLEGWTRSLARPLSGECTIESVDGGPLVGAIAVRCTDGPSTFTTTYRLTAGSPRLDIVVEVDWHHDEHLLSLVLPLDVHTDHAVCDIQLGHIRRPTHASSSWDAAKFEVCAHRFVDVAEPSFGVAVLNDGRYGHAVHDDAVQVSLLRAAKYPDPMADHGEHRVTISVLPHGAGLHDVLGEAEALNRPVRILGGGAAQEVASVSVDHPGVDVDAVKGADDGGGDLVVRLHEACGDRVEVGVGLPDLVSAWRCDLFEAPLGEVPVAGGVARLPLRPFELATVRLRRGPDAVVSGDGRGD